MTKLSRHALIVQIQSLTRQLHEININESPNRSLLDSDLLYETKLEHDQDISTLTKMFNNIWKELANQQERDESTKEGRIAS